MNIPEYLHFQFTLTRNPFPQRECVLGVLDSLLLDILDETLPEQSTIAIYLSGGIDSTILASATRKVRPESVILGFHGFYSESDLYDESRYAEIVADANNIQLIKTEIMEEDLLDVIGDIHQCPSFPCGGPGIIGTAVLSRVVRNYSDIVISGMGGDELFGGYARYLPYYGYDPPNGYRFSEVAAPHTPQCYFDLIDRSYDLDRYVKPEYLYTHDLYQKFLTVFSDPLDFDLNCALPQLCSLEQEIHTDTRLCVPYLDPRMVWAVAAIPPETKIRNGNLKHTMKTMFADYLPVINPAKRGFPIPFVEWAKRSPIQEYLLDTLSPSRDYLQDNFDPMDLITNEPQYSRRLWGLLCMELQCQNTQ